MSETMNVRRVAELAKIALTPEEESRLSHEMEDILALARQLQTLDVQSVPQTQHIQDHANVFRADTEGTCLPREEVLGAAPAQADGCIAVPRTIE